MAAKDEVVASRDSEEATDAAPDGKSLRSSGKEEKPEDNNPDAGADSEQKRAVEDFTLGRSLGEGAYGSVVLGKENATGENFAIKMLEKAHLVREKKVKYATTERDILTLCYGHPNVVKLSYTFKDDTYLYYVMELCSNGELLGQMKHHGSFDLTSSAFYIAEITRALEHLHGKNVIHRDLKPENVLLDDKMHTKITDFGTAKVVSAEDGTRARSNSFVGTAEYVSPELLNDKVTFKASDLWALGCILYQMIAGRPPFTGASEFMIFQKVGAAEYEFPTGFPDVAKDLISKLLLTDPQARLGAQGYGDLKAHPFFTENGIAVGDWDSLHERDPPPIRPFPQKLVFKSDVDQEEDVKRRQMQEDQHEKWKKFLNDNEVILESGLVFKRRGRSVKKRHLLLTNTPRIFYIDTKKMQKKGEVPWSTNLRPEAKNNTAWFIHTPKRTYILDDVQGNSQRWVDAINKQLELALARRR